jgi:ATP-binding cassette subfamily C (CFTR/MRP) protein 1
MTLGYQRTLQAPDLWKMDSTRECGVLSRNFDEAWARRCAIAEEWNARLEKGEVNPSMLTRARWLFTSLHGGPDMEESERQWRTKEGRKEPSIARALNEVFGWTFWSGGLFKVAGDTSQLMSPLLIRALIRFAQERGAAVAAGSPPPALGRGIGMAIGMTLLTIFTSLCQHQWFWRSMATGVLVRAALIGSLYKRGLSMTPKERNLHTGAALVNHMSTGERVSPSRVRFRCSCVYRYFSGRLRRAVVPCNMDCTYPSFSLSGPTLGPIGTVSIGWFCAISAHCSHPRASHGDAVRDSEEKYEMDRQPS